MTIFGWDASNFDLDRDPDGAISMRAVAADGITFVTHKATEGTRTIHSNFKRVMIDSRAAGIEYLGAYMVPRTPGNSGHGSIGAQVDYFLGYATASVPWWRDFPGWFWQVDTERWGTYDAVSPVHGAEACRLLRERTGRQVLHYAPRWAYGDTVPGDDPLWASDYVAGSGPYRALYPGDQSTRWIRYSRRTPAILQYSSSAIIGEQSRCDANAFRGTLADWHRLITGKDPDDMALKDETIKGSSTPGGGDRTADVLLLDIWRAITQGKLSGGPLWPESPLAQLLGRAPASFTAAQIADLGAAIVDHSDTPLGPDDQPAIVAALDSYFRGKLGS